MKRHLNVWIAVLLGLGLCAAGFAMYAGSVAPGLFGPRLIAPDSQGRVWLVVNHTLFVTDKVGNILKQRDLSGIDGGMPVNGLAPLPDKDGQARMLVAAIGQPAWWVMQDGEIVERFVPQEVGGALDEAFHVMTRPDGAIALATGGDHRVLRFDAQGKRLAVSKDGLFRFANGGEHVAGDDGKGVWLVPDTNHHALRLLDADSLAEARAIPLGPGWASMARKSPAADRYTVALMGHNMDLGRVEDIDAQGVTRIHYPLPKGAKPRGLAWVDGTLLVADADSFAFLAFSGDGNALGAWGGRDLKAFLAEAGDAARGWRQATLIAQILAGVLVFAGLVLYFAGKRWLTLGTEPAEPLDLSRLGVPRAEPVARARLALRVLWPTLLLLALFPAVARIEDIAGHLVAYAPDPFLQMAKATHLPPLLLATLAATLIALLLLLILLGLQLHVSLRAMRDPDYEALMAARAMQWLTRSRDVGKALLPGESIREVILADRTLVWVLTNRRLLEFDRGLSENTLVRGLPRSRTRAALIKSRWLPGRYKLCIEAPDYRREGVVHSVATAARIAALLGQGVGADTWLPSPERQSSGGVVPRSPSPAVCLLLSVLWPGLAHWAQNRFRQAIGLMTLALATYLSTVGPILLGVYGHHYDVHTSHIVTAGVTLAVIVGFAAWDALLHARRYRAATVKP